MSKIKGFAQIALASVLLFLLVDMILCRLILNWGFMLDVGTQRMQRHDFPYVEFSGEPGVLDHNDMGYRGKSLRQAPDSAFRILFFAGSTGYFGDPPIPDMLEQKLRQAWNRPVFVANCSVVSSNHRQHLHAMLEQFVNLPADLVIFYGGYNENILPLNYDPRPGYPYNYYYKHECPAWRLFLIRYSAILGEAEKRFGIISGIRSMKDSSPALQRQWYEGIVSMYFQTLADAEKLSTGVIRDQLGKPARFMAFYQPYQVPDAFSRSHAQIRKQIGESSYGVDLSACLDSLSASGAEVYLDRVHVSPGADAVIAGRIADEVVRRVALP